MNNKPDTEPHGIAGAIAEIEKRNGVVHSTPGPWIARDTFGVRGVYLIESNEGMHIASTCELIREKWDEQKANARLIKLAPTLLETLRDAFDLLRNDLSPGKDDLQAIEEVIAKAEGRQS